MNRTFAATDAVLILVLALREPSQAQTPSPTAEVTAAPAAKAQPESSSVSPVSARDCRAFFIQKVNPGSTRER